MKLKEGKISLLINADHTEIELIDGTSGTTFAKITLTPDQLSHVLSRRAYVACEIEVMGLEKLNKQLETADISFEIPEDLKRDSPELYKLALAACPDGWEPDNYFGSQGSFFTKNSKRFAKTIIRRYI